MTRAAVSVLVFALYLVALGTSLVVAPNTLLPVFGLPAVTDAWIRVAGMLLILLAYYYAQAARHGLELFFRWTVHARCTVLVFFLAFVAAGLAPPVLLLFAVVDFAAAMWTWRALRMEGHLPGQARTMGL